jgi:hypothetical protein
MSFDVEVNQDVDARHKAGHDEEEVCGRIEDRIAGVN